MSSIRNIKQYSADSAYSTTTAVSFVGFFLHLYLTNKKKAQIAFRLIDLLTNTGNHTIYHSYFTLFPFHANREQKAFDLLKSKRKAMIYFLFESFELYIYMRTVGAKKSFFSYTIMSSIRHLFFCFLSVSLVSFDDRY